ncbi:MAG: DUF4126 domain-containing protein [Rhodocyclaceae bacterium]|nr:DUF4126 domain-containing protein [Rhodocyclaceae bacterium]
MELVPSLALAGSLAWASGLRLYAVVFMAGMLGRFELLQLPESLRILEHSWVLLTAGLLLTIEFFADKVPAVDTLWDSIHTFIRIPAGALLAALAMGGHDPALMVVAGLLGGTLTAGTHAFKAGSRTLVNTSPEPFSNIGVSLGEDVLVASGLLTAIYHPIIFLVLLVVFIGLLIWLLPKLWRGIRLVFARVFGKQAAPAKVDKP